MPETTEPTVETAAEYEAQIARPAIEELERQLAEALERDELDCDAQQATRLFKGLAIESAQANVDGVQWTFTGGIVLRFALDESGVGFYRVRLVP